MGPRGGDGDGIKGLLSKSQGQISEAHGTVSLTRLPDLSGSGRIQHVARYAFYVTLHLKPSLPDPARGEVARSSQVRGNIPFPAHRAIRHAGLPAATSRTQPDPSSFAG